MYLSEVSVVSPCSVSWGNIKGGCQGKQIEPKVIPHHGRALKALAEGNLPDLAWQSWLFPAPHCVELCWPFPGLCDSCVWMGLLDTAQVAAYNIK